MNNKKEQYLEPGNDRYINIRAGQEYQLRIIDENSEISKDFFYDVYCKAFAEVIKIVNENEAKGNGKNDILETSNNIIAFCGERGQGKSSSMLSFSKILKNIDKEKINSHFSVYADEIKDKRFHILSRIDPTELENEQSILSVIVSRIFHDFKLQLKNGADKDFLKKNKLLELFQQCYQDIELIKKQENKCDEMHLYEDDLEMLSKLSDGANIKSDFFQLIKIFLEFMDDKDLLVIQIDDTDLNVENAYQIVEDIRKYFMIPRVIVLMATKLEQLINSISQGYMKSFKELRDAGGMSLRDFHQMATKYIGKLIPGSRCIILPEVALCDETMARHVQLKYFDFNEQNNKETVLLEGPLQEKVLEYIYQKTGIIFVSSSNATHNILPKTARGLANFLSVLNGLKDIKQVESFSELDDDDIHLRLLNIEKFEEYFLNTWIEEKVSVAYIDGLQEWSKAALFTKNKLFIYNISKINKLFPSVLLERSPIVKELRTSILDDVYNSYSRRGYYDSIFKYDLYDLKTLNSEPEITFTLSDILDTLAGIDDYYPEADNNKLTFSMRVLYSIVLNKLILNQILNERNNKYTDNTTPFIGEIYGSKVNRFMRKERNRYDRAYFTFNMPEENYYDWAYKLNEDGQIVKSLFMKTSNAKDDEKGGAFRCEFNVTWPLLNGLKPYSKQIWYSVNALEETIETNAEYEQFRYNCFQIVSNIELLDELRKRLVNKPLDYYTFRVRGSSAMSYIDGFYFRLNYELNDIPYLKKDIDRFSYISSLLQKTDKTISFIYEQRYSSSDTYMSKYGERLKPYIKTETFEKYENRLTETYAVFDEILELNIDIAYEIQEIRKLREKLDKDKGLAKSTYLERQRIMNRLRKSVLNKLENMKE